VLTKTVDPYNAVCHDYIDLFSFENFLQIFFKLIFQNENFFFRNLNANFWQLEIRWQTNADIFWESSQHFISSKRTVDMSNLVLKVKRLSEHATLPVRASPGAAGYDLFAAADQSIEAHGKALIKTDISISLPSGHYGRIAPRSSLAWKHHIDVGAGVIDQDYRSQIGVVLFNHSNEIFEGMFTIL
jgi:dUTPase